MESRFFETPEDLQAWFDANHETASEVLVGFHRVGSGLSSITWSQAVDEALCVGWIDGITRRIDSSSYAIRFTPRRPRSTWSSINIAKVAELTAAGRMRPAGERAFAARSEGRSRTYSYEQAPAELDGPEQAAFEADVTAWLWFSRQPPSYRRAALHWVVSAKQPETRARRLETLIADSAAGRTIRHLTRPTGKRTG